jgi:hypothetical protein
LVAQVKTETKAQIWFGWMATAWLTGERENIVICGVKRFRLGSVRSQLIVSFVSFIAFDSDGR